MNKSIFLLMNTEASIELCQLTSDEYRTAFCQSKVAWGTVNLIQHALDNDHRVRIGPFGEGWAIGFCRGMLEVQWDDGSTGRHHGWELEGLLRIVYIEMA